jgi:probable F420-dependent oxidoreductase
VSRRVEGVLPFWLDRPDEEALAIAGTVGDVGLDGLWIGEMATYDAFALATAVGLRVPGLPLRVGPLAAGVRTPVAIALGVGSVASLTGAEVDVALGASSPMIVTGWHDREWGRAAARVRETVECLRPLLAGARSNYDGSQIRSHGFRLRQPRPHTRIGVGAFGPEITRVAARYADEIVLNLVPPQRVAGVRTILDGEAAKAGRTPARLTVWVPAAFEPGAAALRQMAAQLALYLGPPGYGEMFSDLGFGDLVRRARAGAGRMELAEDIPADLVGQIGLAGSAERIGERLRAYQDAGADCVAVVPSTAEDPGGRNVLTAVAGARRAR